MTEVRSHPDPNQPGAFKGPTTFKTDRNEHEVRCGMCGQAIYVDEEMFRFAKEGIEAGLDNPFKCETCEQEYDALSYDG